MKKTVIIILLCAFSIALFPYFAVAYDDSYDNPIIIEYGTNTHNVTLAYDSYGPNSFDVNDEHMYILDTWGHSIKKYTMEGKYVNSYHYPDHLYAMDMEIYENTLFIMCDDSKIYSASIGAEKLVWSEVSSYSPIDVVCLASENNAVYARVVEGTDTILTSNLAAGSVESKTVEQPISTSSAVISGSKITICKNGINHDVALKGTPVGTFVLKTVDSTTYVVEKEALLGLGYVEVRIGKYINGQKTETAILTQTATYTLYIPYKYYCLSDDGVVYQMIPTSDGICIKEIAWQTGHRTMISDSMAEKNAEVCSNSSRSSNSVRSLSSLSTPSLALSRARAMCTYSWTYNSTTHKTPTTSSLQSPSQLGDVSGTKTGIPYCVGGMNGLDSSFVSSPLPNQTNFITAINVNGQKAGNISFGAATWQGGTAGLDCSGLICQAYKIAIKYHAQGLINAGIAHKIIWHQVVPGDIAIRPETENYLEHVFMIQEIMYLSSGQINKVLTCESTRDASQERAQMLSYTYDNLSAFTPYEVY